MQICISGYNVLIDDDDYDKISKYKWNVNKRDAKKGRFYFQTVLYYKGTKKRKLIKLHRTIMDRTTGDGIDVDHINGDTLDNRKCNLRNATKAENNRNRRKTKHTLYKGVFAYNNNTYRAVIGYDYKFIHITQSSDPIYCAKMYDMMAIKLHGEFACLNFSKDDYTPEMINDAYLSTVSFLKATNSSGYMGVTYHKRDNVWQSSIGINKRRTYLGSFDDIKDAAKQYDAACIYLRKEKALTNFPQETYTKEYIDSVAQYINSPLPKTNSTGYRGVVKHTETRWESSIGYKDKGYYLGIFPTAEEAARAYDKKARELLGDKAKLNFPEES